MKKLSNAQKIAIGAAAISTLAGASLIPTTLAAANTQQPHGHHMQGGKMGMRHAGMNFGQITTISGNTLTVQSKNGTTFTVDATSAKVMVNGQASSVSGLAVNDQILVQGQPASAGSTQITAQAIFKGIMNFGPKDITFGEITLVNGNTITVQSKNGTAFTVDATSAKIMVNGQVSSLSALAVNDQIVVKGQPVAQGSTQITAQAIFKGPMKKGPQMGMRGHHGKMKPVTQPPLQNQ